jgi:F-box/TPR repeat protein Pof3
MPPLPTDKQNRGQILYRQGKYTEALEVFTSILDKWIDPPLTVFDNRAATYIKLGKLENALKDGRSMIKRNKKDISGYLRTGQILQKMEKAEAALKIYEYGLGQVDISNAQLLRSEIEKIQTKFKQQSARDILAMMPLELVEAVLSYLTFKEFLPLLRVSKSWRALLINNQRLWRDLDFPYSRKPVKLSSVKTYAKRAGYAVTRFAGTQMNSYNSIEAAAFIIGSCKDLRDLQICEFGERLGTLLPRCQSLASLKINSQITWEKLLDITNQCKGLKEGSFLCLGKPYPGKPGIISTSLQSLQVEAVPVYPISMPANFRISNPIDIVSIFIVYQLSH